MYLTNTFLGFFMKNYWDQLTVKQQEDLAAVLKTSTDYLRQVFNGYRTVSAKRAIAIDKATSGAVTRAELLPDIFQA